MKVSDAATQLGVSRQAIYDIRGGKYCPSLPLIQRACDVWGIQFSFRGLPVGKVTLRSKKKPATQLPPQPSLFDALARLENQQLEVVKAKRVGSAVELVLRLTISA
jgi:DNA-binding XRE family transcriptional regulator